VGAARIDGTAVPAFPRPSGTRALSLDPSGTAIEYDDSAGGWFRVVTSDQPTPASVWFSQQGHKAALVSQRRLVVQNVDGSDSHEIATDCQCGNVVFSPDGSRMAYDGRESPADTVGKVFVVPVAGGTKTTLGFANGGDGVDYLAKTFSPGGRWLSKVGINDRLAIADSLSSGDFAIVAGPSVPIDVASNDDFIIYRGVGASVWLAPLPFANSSVLLNGVSYPLGFQPAPGSTRVAVLNNRETTTYLADLEIYDARIRARIGAVRDIQGGGRTGFELARNPFWAGRVMVFAFNARKPPGGQAVFDLGAVSEDGSVSGTLATEVLQYEWYREARAPGRIFFARSRASGGGLWTLLLPK
jgi:hypothetical protein